ncbi:MAG: hypothetical protein ACWGQW_01650 [bacterium]
MTKLQAYFYLCKISQDLSFLANIILTRKKNPARRLKKLVDLVNDGKDVKLASFSCDILLMDGEEVSWSILD